MSVDGKERQSVSDRSAVRCSVPGWFVWCVATAVGQWFAAMCTTLIAFAIPPLELLPFAVAAPAAAILMFGLGITARDGDTLTGTRA